MARKSDEGNTEATPTPQPVAASAAPAPDERFRMVTDPETGQQVKRKDFIMKYWQEKKWSRGQIAKKLTEITGKEVKYQIVFAATKKVPGGPDKPAEAPAAPAAA